MRTLRKLSLHPKRSQETSTRIRTTTFNALREEEVDLGEVVAVEEAATTVTITKMHSRELLLLINSELNLALPI